MKKFTVVIILSLLLFLLISCDQAPLFFIVSNEVKPKDPSVEGSPSRIAPIGDSLFIANGNILEYRNRWNKISKPKDPVKDILAEGNTLYALTLSSSSTETKLWQRISADSWAEITNTSGYNFLQSLYSCNGEIFVSGRQLDGGEYAILHLAAGALQALKTNTAWLSGAVFLDGYYYFATNSNGVYRGRTLTADGLAVIEKSNNYKITGIISTGREVIAVTTNGYLLNLTSGEVKSSQNSISNTVFTGSLAIWEHNNERLLLAGVHRSSGVYGYLEFAFNADGTVDIENNRAPGNDADVATTVPPEKRYQCETSIGTHSISHLYVLSSDDPEKLPVVFASTQKNGLYAFRDNEWNAEE